MKTLSLLAIALAAFSLPARVHAQFGPLQPVRVPGEAVSFAEAHLHEEIYDLNTGSSSAQLAEKTDQATLNATASTGYAGYPKWNGSAWVVMNSAQHDFHIGASLAMTRARFSGTIPEVTYYVAGYASALHEEKLHFTSLRRHPGAVVHLRFRMFAAPVPADDGLMQSIILLRNGSFVPTAPQPKVGGKQTIAGDYDLPIPIAELNSAGTDAKYSVELTYASGATAAAQLPPDAGLFLRTIEVTEASGQRIDDLRITSESGFDYNAFINAEHGRFLKFSGGYRGVLQLKTGEEISPMADGIFSSRITGGSISIAFTFHGEKFAAVGKVRGLGAVTFGPRDETTLDFSGRELGRFRVALSLVQEGDAYSLTGTLHESPHTAESDGRVWRIQAGHAIYSAQPDRWGGYRGVPVPLIGQYTALLEPGATTPDGVPPGAGWALLSVRANGDVALAGRLADGAAISVAGPLIEGGVWPFEALPYGGLGSLTGVAEFAPGEFNAASVRWTRPATKSPRYPAGWPDGVALDFHGSKFERPSGVVPDIAASVQFLFSGGGLATPLRLAANIGAHDRIAAAAPNAGQLTAAINAGDGRIAGAFLHNASGVRVEFRGVVLQKQKRAGGWFRGPADFGAMSLAPAP